MLPTNERGFTRGDTGNQDALKFTDPYLAEVNLHGMLNATVKLDKTKSAQDKHSTQDKKRWVPFGKNRQNERSSAEQKGRRDSKVEAIVSEVRALQRILISPADKTSRSKDRIEELKNSREEKHTAVMEEHNEISLRIHKEIGDGVAKICSDYNAQLKQAEKMLDNMIVKLVDETILNMKQDDFEDIFTQIQTIFAHRAEEQEALKNNLLDMETLRKDLIEEEFTRLVDMLVDIAFMLPNDIEKLLHTQMKEVNVHIVRNRASYVELIARLDAASIRSFEKYKKAWEERQVVWRGLRYSRCLEHFQETINSDRFQKPEKRAELFADLCLKQQQLQTDLMKKMDVLLALLPPHTTCAQIDDLRAEVQELYSEHDYACDQAILAIEEYELNLHEEANRLITNLTLELLRIEHKPAEEVKENIAKQSEVAENTRYDEIKTLLTKVRAVHERDEQMLMKKVDHVCEFYMSIAKTWEGYDKKLVHENMENDEKIAQRYDQYCDQITDAEHELSIKLTELARASNFDTLQALWEKVGSLVGPDGSIKHIHLSWHDESRDMAVEYPSRLEHLINHTMDSMAVLLGLRTHQEEKDRLDAIAEERRKQEEIKQQALQEEAKQRRKKNRMNSSKKRPTSKGKTLAEEPVVVEPEPVLLPTSDAVSFKRLNGEITSYVVVHDADEMFEIIVNGESNLEIMNMPPPQVEEVVEERPSSKGKKKKSKKKEKKEKKSEDTKSKKAIARKQKEEELLQQAAEEEERLKAEAEQKRQEEHDRNVLQGILEPTEIIEHNGYPCLYRIQFRSSSDTSEIVPRLRYACMETMDQLGMRHLLSEQKMMRNRCSEFATDTDLEMRKYRPRYARYRVEILEERDNRLDRNIERFQRFKKRMIGMVDSTSAILSDRIAEGMQELNIFYKSVSSSIQELGTAESLAALNHMNKKVKQRQIELTEICKEREARLHNIVRELEEQANDADRKWLLSCVTFNKDPEGGTYHEDEFKHYRGKVKEMAIARGEQLTHNRESLATFHQDVERLLSMEKFDSHLNFTLQELSVNQGLGHKHGAPKRILSTTLRSEYAVSEGEANDIDEMLDQLERVCNSDGYDIYDLKTHWKARSLALATEKRETARNKESSRTTARTLKEPDTKQSTSFSFKTSDTKSENKSDVPALDAAAAVQHEALQNNEQDSLAVKTFNLLDSIRKSFFSRAFYLDCGITERIKQIDMKELPLSPLLGEQYPLVQFDLSGGVATEEPTGRGGRSALGNKSLSKEKDKKVSTRDTFRRKRTMSKVIEIPKETDNMDDRLRYRAIVEDSEQKCLNKMTELVKAYYIDNAEHIVEFRSKVAAETAVIEDIEVLEEKSPRKSRSHRSKEDRKSKSSKSKSSSHKKEEEIIKSNTTRLPQVLVDFVDKEKIKAFEKLFVFVDQFKAQVVRCNKLIVNIPEVLMNNICIRSLKDVSNARDQIAEEFDVEINRLETQRMEFLQRLKPALDQFELGSFEKLDKEENERQKAMLSLNAKKRDAMLKLEQSHSRLFLQRIVHGCQVLISLLDTLVFPADFPLDKLDVKERLSMKNRIREFNRKQYLAQEDAVVRELAAQARFPSSTWAAIDFSQFDTAMTELQQSDIANRVAAGLVVEKKPDLNDEEKDSTSIEAKKGAKVTKGSKPTTAKENMARRALSKQSSNPQSTPRDSNKEDISPSVSGFQLPHSRSSVLFRDQVVASYLKELKKNVAEHMKVALNMDILERSYAQQWQKKTSNLKRTQCPKLG